MTGEVYDLFIVGGGINGCGIARDAVGRGYSVFLAEMNDFASGTSRAATKLIHGGLRYLEHYEFRLVRESLMHALLECDGGRERVRDEPGHEGGPERVHERGEHEAGRERVREQVRREGGRERAHN